MLGALPPPQDALMLRKLLAFYFEPFNLQHTRVLMDTLESRRRSGRRFVATELAHRLVSAPAHAQAYAQQLSRCGRDGLGPPPLGGWWLAFVDWYAMSSTARHCHTIADGAQSETHSERQPASPCLMYAPLHVVVTEVHPPAVSRQAPVQLPGTEANCTEETGVPAKAASEPRRADAPKDSAPRRRPLHRPGPCCVAPAHVSQRLGQGHEAVRKTSTHSTPTKRQGKGRDGRGRLPGEPSVGHGDAKAAVPGKRSAADGDPT